MKKLTALRLTGAIVGIIALAATPLSSAQASTLCRIDWGVRPKMAADTANGELTNIHAGRYTCYDRMVFDMKGPASGFYVGYASDVYIQETGQKVPVLGGAKLRIVVSAPDHDPTTFQVSYNATPGKKLPNIDLTGYKTFREAKYAGSYEAQTTIALGVQSQQPFRAYQLNNQVIVDVAHSW
jgi:hypothetical protein